MAGGECDVVVSVSVCVALWCVRSFLASRDVMLLWEVRACARGGHATVCVLVRLEMSARAQPPTPPTAQPHGRLPIARLAKPVGEVSVTWSVTQCGSTQQNAGALDTGSTVTWIQRSTLITLPMIQTITQGKPPFYLP